MGMSSVFLESDYIIYKCSLLYGICIIMIRVIQLKQRQLTKEVQILLDYLFSYNKNNADFHQAGNLE